MKIYIYVQSRGISQDYCWLTENIQHRVPSPIPQQITDLIQTEALSVVIARLNNQLLLLVTGLEASDRTDFQNRKIRNSVAWLGEDSDKDERTLRALAVSALRGSLKNSLKDSLKEEIDRAVKSGSEEGFQVSFKDIRELTSRAEAGDQPLKPGMEKKQIGRTSDELKDQLANELEKYRLPRSESEAQSIVPLVVVTGIQAREALEKAGVWRSLSSLIDSNSNGWEELRNYGNKAPNDFLNFFLASLQEISKRLVLVLLVISLGFNIWLLQQLMLQGGLQEQNKNLRKEQKELQEQNKKLNNETKKLDNENQLKLKQADELRIIWENATNQMQQVLKSNTSLEVIK